jgi:hypothetical protein
VSRVSGAEGVWFSLNSASEGLPFDRAIDLLVKSEFGEYYTKTVWGVSAEGDFRAPGFVGSCMVLGGMVGVVWLSIAFMIGLAIAWRALSKARTPIVLKAYVGNMFLLSVSENPFAYKTIVGMIVTCLTIEFCWRFFFVSLLERTDVKAMTAGTWVASAVSGNRKPSLSAERR